MPVASSGPDPEVDRAADHKTIGKVSCTKLKGQSKHLQVLRNKVKTYWLLLFWYSMLWIDFIELYSKNHGEIFRNLACFVTVSDCKYFELSMQTSKWPGEKRRVHAFVQRWPSFYTKYSTVLQVLLLTALKFPTPSGVSLMQSLMMWVHTDLFMWGRMK